MGSLGEGEERVAESITGVVGRGVGKERMLCHALSVCSIFARRHEVMDK